MGGELSFFRTSAIVYVAAMTIVVAALWLGPDLNPLGSQIPRTDSGWDYLVGLGVAGGLALLVAGAPLPEKKHLLIIWGIRTSITCFWMVVYESSYEILDAYTYFAMGASGDIPESGGAVEGSTKLILRITQGMCAVTGDSYRAVVVLYSFLGFAGVWLVYRAVVLYFRRDVPALLYLIGLFPSVVFWSSILGKEPVNLLALGIYAFGIAGWLRKHEWRYLGIALLGIGLVAWIRPWWGIITTVPLFGAWSPAQPVRKRLAVAGAGLSILIVMLAFVAGFFRFEEQGDLVERVNAWGRNVSTGGSAQEAPEFHGVSDLLWFLPMGIARALFLPLPWDANNFQAFLAGLENCVLVFLLLWAAAHARPRRIFKPFIRWAILVALCWLFIYAFISFPNLGTAVRYKSNILPILLIPVWLLAFRGGRRLLEAPESPTSLEPVRTESPA